MKFDQLVYFLETAKQQHVGRAAGLLRISPSAVSHSIAHLERELGCALFAREGKRIYLTPEGSRLAERAEVLLRELNGLKESLASETKLEGHHKLAFTHGLGSFFASAWTELREQHPALSIELYSLRSAEVLAQASTGAIDLGFCLSPQSHPSVQARHLVKGALHLCVRKNHPVLRRPAKERHRALAGFPGAAPKAFQGIENCERHPAYALVVPKMEFSYVFDSYDAAVSYLQVSDAWALLPDFWLKHKKTDIVPVTKEPSAFAYTIAAVWPQKRPLTRALKLLVDRLETEAQS